MTFLAFFVSLPFCLYAQQSNQKKLANEEGEAVRKLNKRSTQLN